MEEPRLVPPHDGADLLDGLEPFDQDDDEQARHALRLRRQMAIREGRYLPPFPQIPMFLHQMPQPEQINEAFDRAMEFQLQQRRQFLLQHLRPAHFQPGGFFDPQPENDYRPLSPTNSDDEDNEEEDELERQRRIRQNWRNYINQRQEPIPEEIIDRLLQEYEDRWANEQHNQNPQQNRNNNDDENNVNVDNNNIGNFRNFNGMLSPSPSPTPSVSSNDSDNEEEDPFEQARIDDNDIEMLNAEMFDLRPHQPRPRKRQSSEEPRPIKKKRVTFREDSSDEDDHPDYENNNQLHRKHFGDDDDEEYFAGPPNRQNSLCH